MDDSAGKLAQNQQKRIGGPHHISVIVNYLLPDMAITALSNQSARFRPASSPASRRSSRKRPTTT